MNVRHMAAGILLAVIGSAEAAGAAPGQNPQGKGQAFGNASQPQTLRKDDRDADKPEAGPISEILTNQRQMLEMLSNMQNSTLPNQTQVLANIARLQDAILLSEAALIKQVSGFELACTTPDVLPLPLPGGNFCDLRVTPGQPDKLHVRVINQGGGAAVASTTIVLFHALGGPGGAVCSTDCVEVDVPTLALGGFGISTSFDVDVPPACYDAAHDAFGNGVCEFKIVVDGQGVVAESNELNNNAGGQCPRPIIIN